MCPPTGALKVLRSWELTDARPRRRGGRRGALEELAGAKVSAGAAGALAARYRRKGWLRVAYRVHVAGAAPVSRELSRGEVTPGRLGPRQRAALELVEKTGVSDELTVRAATGLSLAGLRRLLEAGALVDAGAEGAAAPRRPPTDRIPRPPTDQTRGRRRRPAGSRRRRLRAAAQAARVAACAVLSDVPDLLPEQRAAVHEILCRARPGEEVLLHGVTGSGKTEVYLQAAQAALEGGRSVLFLVPEIGLTGQTVRRVQERFAGHRVAVLHSGLTARERLLSYRAIAEGEVRLVVGARSAVFAPLRDLGLVVVDEEHDTSYKQESEPAYDARTVARWRAEQSGAVVVLGSATPSVEAYARVPLHADLRRRVDGSVPPVMEVVDMRDHHGVFSDTLAQALTATIDAGEKAILFLNRRGFASYLICDHCGHAWVCPALRRHAHPVLRRAAALPRLRAHRTGARGLPRLRQDRPRASRVRDGASRARGAGAAARGRAPAPGLGRRYLLPPPADGARALRRAGGQGPRRHADDRQGAPLPRGHPGGRGQRRRRAPLPRLPRRGAHVLDAGPGGRAQRPRRAPRAGSSCRP